MASQPPPSAAGFINSIADRFQQKHIPLLSRDSALAMAVSTLEWFETSEARFGDERFAWDEGGAHDLADEEISYWENSNGQA